MTSSPLSPRITAGGMVLVDPPTSRVLRVYSFLYYPDTISRTVTPQFAEPDTGDRLDALRLRAPAIETIRVDLDLDATDWMATPNRDPASQLAAQDGLLPQLAVLESVLSPSFDQVQTARNEILSGILEISPIEAPLTIFVWNRRRSVPVRITELTANEEMFDPALNPIRARVSLTLRVLTTHDLPYTHAGANVYLQYLRQQESLQRSVPTGTLTDVGSLGLHGVGR